MVDLNQVSVSTIMVENIISVKESDSIEYIDALFLEFQVGHILVVDDNENLTGLISRQDYLSYLRYISKLALAKEKPSLHFPLFRAKELMTSNLVVLNPTDSVYQAKEEFLTSKYHCLPIVSNGQIVGIVTPLDLLRLM